MAKIPLPDLEEMSAGGSSGILDLVGFAIKYQQNVAVAKNNDRSQAATIMSKASQGINVNSSVEDIQGAIDFITETAGDDVVQQDFAEATNQRLNSVLEQREGMDAFIESLQVTKNALRDVTKKGREGTYDVSEARKIMDNIEKNYLDNVRHVSNQPGLTTMLNNQLTEAQDAHTAISLMEQLDAVKGVEGEVESLYIQLPDETKDLPVKWKDRYFPREELAGYAQDEFDANNFTGASKILGEMLVDSQGRGMKLSSDIKALSSYYDTAYQQLFKFNKEVDSEYPVMPVIKKLISNSNANMILTPKEIESAFHVISKYIYDVARDEEWFNPPESVDNLDEYLSDYRESLLEDLDNKNLSNALANILLIRDGLARSYKEAYGKDLILQDEDLQFNY